MINWLKNFMLFRLKMTGIYLKRLTIEQNFLELERK